MKTIEVVARPKKKILIINNSSGGLYVFRGPIIVRLLRDGYEVVTISPYGKFINEVQALGITTYEVEFDGHSVGVFKGLAIIKKLYKIIKKENPDIVHCFTHKPNIFGTIAAKLAGKKIIIMTLTGLGTLFTFDDFRTKLLKRFLIWQYKFTSKLASYIVFQNPDDLREFGSFGINKSKFVLVNGSGIDLQEYPLPSSNEVKGFRLMVSEEIGSTLDNKILILFPARALKEKGFIEYYEAARAINSITDKYVFLHLGLVVKHSKSGITQDSIETFAKKCGVYFLGFKPNLKNYMTACDIVVLSSYREGTPRSLIEALALNKMIVTSNAPGCRETVIDGWNGYYCDVGDSKSLASRILLSEQLVDKLGNRPRLLCKTKYDVQIQYRKFAELYHHESL